MAPDWLTALIRDFGQHLGIPALALNDRDALCLSVENGCQLRLEYRGERLVAAVLFPIRPTTGNLEALLQSVHPSQNIPFIVHAGTDRDGNAACYGTALNAEELTMPNLLQRFETLWRLAQTALMRLEK